MHVDKKIEALSSLGDYIKNNIDTDNFLSILHKVYLQNPWFTVGNSRKALQAIAEEFLDSEKLYSLKKKYYLDNLYQKSKVGLVLAGNIPAVGFHDLLCVFLTNQSAQIKLSSKDNILIPLLLDQLIKINPEAGDYFEYVDRLKDYQAVIATGGNNTSRYFEYYFKEVPHVIRKSRSSVGIITGDESDQDISDLGKDIFTYFGLGCRNVSKLMVPKGYDLKILLKALDDYEKLSQHNKYANNYDYSLALYMLNKEEVLANNCVVFRECPDIASRIACVHYEFYDDEQDLFSKLDSKRNEIQCIVGKESVSGFDCFNFGQAQNPGLLDYADGVDTIQFLMTIDEKV